jgi:uncharacterized protein with GYD domain
MPGDTQIVLPSRERVDGNMTPLEVLLAPRTERADPSQSGRIDPEPEEEEKTEGRSRKMSTFVLLSKFSPDAFREPNQLKVLAEQVGERIRTQCPEAKWRHSYSLLGGYDVIDIFDAPDEKTAERVAMIIRAHGHSTTETFLATPWKEFLDSL